MGRQISGEGDRLGGEGTSSGCGNETDPTVIVTRYSASIVAIVENDLLMMSTSSMEQFGESVSYDRRLYKEDIRGSCAHASMLAEQGLISHEELQSIVSGLERIEDDIESGKFEWLTSREDGKR